MESLHFTASLIQLHMLQYCKEKDTEQMTDSAALQEAWDTGVTAANRSQIPEH